MRQEEQACIPVHANQGQTTTLSYNLVRVNDAASIFRGARPSEPGLMLIEYGDRLAAEVLDILPPDDVVAALISAVVHAGMRKDHAPVKVARALGLPEPKRAILVTMTRFGGRLALD